MCKVVKREKGHPVIKSEELVKKKKRASIYFLIFIA